MLRMEMLLLILGMSVVTYIPRALPAVAFDKIKIPARVEGVLSAIPYAVLGSLIYPGILSVEKGNPVIGITGGLVAVVLSCCKLRTTFVVCGSVLTVVIMKMLGI